LRHPGRDVARVVGVFLQVVVRRAAKEVVVFVRREFGEGLGGVAAVPGGLGGEDSGGGPVGGGVKVGVDLGG
jgi:hypothetical protein